MNKQELIEYQKIARKAVAEGCVLLKNDNHALPLKKGNNIAVFGRCAFYYYKSGLGSGGLVNTEYVVSILDALEECKDITINQKVKKYYEDWMIENPIEAGKGWGNVPWSQKEMPLTEEIVKEARNESDAAIVIIGRTAGEDQDNNCNEGSYCLTETEKDMIKKVSNTFEKTIVLLNVGNIIDMEWVNGANPAAVMYVWQGGQEGGNGVVDVLTGIYTPSGHLTDTIAKSITDYPSDSNFGSKERNYYKEDIFVGYRYFSTFAEDKVRYPFGFGLSYTQFQTNARIGKVDKEVVYVKAKVKNTGNYAGKEVVQVYISAPKGLLGKPGKVLVGFVKTKELQPGEEQECLIECPKTYFSSYDDSGVTGNKSCFVLEAGTYEVYAGNNVRDAKIVGSYEQRMTVLSKHVEACAPVKSFQRMHLTDKKELVYEDVPVRSIDLEKRIKDNRDEEISYTGDKGYKLVDVLDQKVDMNTFVAQLSDEDLIALFHGEGMCSPKVTPGTAAAFGGVTESLKEFGIPVCCCADGPSGIRMDCGTIAFSLPNGTALGCSFNVELVEELFTYMGKELLSNQIDSLLGPGINIHRHPLNGRNFEYFSEDPILTGKMCVAQLQGMHKSNVTGTIKHFCANNQEQNRSEVDSVVSERALREIYLKVYEIAVKEGKARSIMTTYGPLNGLWTAGNYDLCTTILRNDWGYEGIVMSDWWACSNWENEGKTSENRAPMVIAQNDIFMVCPNSEKEIDNDNVKECFDKGIIARSDLQRNAKNVLTFVMNSATMQIFTKRMEKPVKELIGTGKNNSSQEELFFSLTTDTAGIKELEVEYSSDMGELAQIAVSIYINNIYSRTFNLKGTNGEVARYRGEIGYAMAGNHYIKVAYKKGEITIKDAKF